VLAAGGGGGRGDVFSGARAELTAADAGGAGGAVHAGFPFVRLDGDVRRVDAVVVGVDSLGLGGGDAAGTNGAAMAGGGTGDTGGIDEVLRRRVVAAVARVRADAPPPPGGLASATAAARDRLGRVPVGHAPDVRPRIALRGGLSCAR